MNKCLYNGVDIFNPIENNLNEYIDAFVMVYGEKYRNIITKRLQNAKYFFLGGSIETIIEKYNALKEAQILAISKDNKLNNGLKIIKINKIKEKSAKFVSFFENKQKKQQEINNKYNKAYIDYLENEINNIRAKNGLLPLEHSEAQKYVNPFWELLTIGKKSIQDRISIITPTKKAKYTELFNALGYNKPEFKDYLFDDHLMDNIFKSFTIKQLNFWNSEQQKELKANNILIQNLKEELEALNLHYGTDEIFEIGSQYISNETKYSAYVVAGLQNNSNFITMCFCNNALELETETLVHEMGHIIDSFVVESNKEGFFYKIGYELHYYGLTPYIDEISGLPTYLSKHDRETEMFNEMVNEFITLKVAKILNNSKVLTLPQPRQSTSFVKYDFGFEIFEEFLEKYQDKLIELKLEIDKNDKTYNFFGKNNFKNLTVLAEEYINKRTELNTRYHKGEDVQKEIDELKLWGKEKLAVIEKKIEKNISKQQHKQRKKANNILAIAAETKTEYGK